MMVIKYHLSADLQAFKAVPFVGEDLLCSEFYICQLCCFVCKLSQLFNEHLKLLSHQSTPGDDSALAYIHFQNHFKRCHLLYVRWRSITIICLGLLYCDMRSCFSLRQTVQKAFYSHFMSFHKP